MYNLTEISAIVTAALSLF